MRYLLSSLALAASVFAAGAASQATAKIAAPDLLTPHFGAKDPENKSLFKRARTVRVDTQLLRRARVGHLVRIRMFDDADFTVRLEELEVEQHIKDAFHWRGEIVGRVGSEVILTVHENSFSGWIFPNDPKFQSLCIQPAPGTFVARELIDAMHQGSVIPAPADARDAFGIQSNCNDSAQRIDVTMVYDISARVAAGSTAGIRAACINSVAQANTCLSRSSISTRFYVKAVRAVSYTTSGNQSTDLSRLRSTTDRFMDEVHTWRKTDNSDLVALVRGGGGGTAYCYNGWTTGFSVNGYSSLGSMVVAHEFGHNLGCGHDPANNTPGNRCINTSYGRGHNWKYDESGFPIYRRRYAYTVMSYSSNWGSCSFPWTCSKTRQPNYSSPLVNLIFSTGRFPSGTTTRDNRRTILDFRQRVANFSRTVQGYHVAPVITSQPRSTSVSIGYNAPRTLMSVRATGATRYQWRRNGRNITGQTTSSLRISITNATSAIAGRYDCVVSGPCFSRTSSGATLTVGPTRVLRYAASGTKAVANLGDVDGDRYDDFAVTRPFASSTTGVLTVFRGRTHQVMTAWQFSDRSQLGTAVAGADLDGDAYRDILISAPAYQSNRGRILFQSGANARTGARGVGAFRTGTVAGKQLGRILAVGRFDAAAGEDVVAAGTDTLWAFSSRSGRPQLWTVAPIAGQTITALVTVGDVNSDGYDDVAVGIASRSTYEIRSGRNGARIRGQTFTGSTLVGWQLAAPGDVNGDKIPDLVFSAPAWGSNRGWIRLVSGANLAQINERLGTVVNGRLGYVLSGGGDYSRDGYNDVVATSTPTSSSGRATVLVLNGRDVRRSFVQRPGNASWGRATALVDADGDGASNELIADFGSFVSLNDRAPKASPPAFTIYGRAGPGSSGRLARINSGLPLARISGRQIVKLSGALPRSAVICRLAIGRANVPLDGLGMTGSSLLTGTPLVDWVVPTDAGGRAQFTLPLSTNTRFTGLRLTWQWYVLDRRANSFGLTASDAAEMVVGAR